MKYNIQGVCPKCGNSNLDYGYFHNEGDFGHYDYTCLDCGCEGLEYYVFNFDGHMVRDEEGNWINMNDNLNPGEFYIASEDELKTFENQE